MGNAQSSLGYFKPKTPKILKRKSKHSLFNPTSPPIPTPYVPKFTDLEHEEQLGGFSDVIDYILGRPLISPLEPSAENILLITANGLSTIPQLLRMFPGARITYHDMIPTSGNPETDLMDGRERVSQAPLDLFSDTLSLPSNKYDLVLLRQINRSLPEERWIPLLREARRVCRTGGFVEVIGFNGDVQGAGVGVQRAVDALRDITGEHQIKLGLVDELGPVYMTVGLPPPTHSSFQCPMGSWGGVVGKMTQKFVKGYVEIIIASLRRSNQHKLADEFESMVKPWEDGLDHSEAYLVIHDLFAQVQGPEEN
ncbi:MAG: hypothetical protein DHS80DRAFT_21055 [Piptocephalis tieghemiana]|nr:MAG: hypothetical protein DHS80DRAFT_21055 [Piptocephalis tieghemiana]